ncbi:PadR family transcriptional regulator [Paenibacillus peoriae]|uniref:PadR family transcriptional regulator n=1 Tax=Paenibacillus peoriae TaxID=59893 RepID=UPI0030D209CD
MSLQIFILGLLSNHDYHPYDVKKKIIRDTRNMVNVTDGNLYYNFEALLKKGMIKKSQVIQSDNRPDKITYSITPKGQDTLKEEIYKTFRNAKSIKSLIVALPFVEKVDINKLIFYVEEVIERFSKRLVEIEEYAITADSDSNIQQYRLLMREFSYENMNLEIKMFNKLLLLLKSQKREDEEK